VDRRGPRGRPQGAAGQLKTEPVGVGGSAVGVGPPARMSGRFLATPGRMYTEDRRQAAACRTRLEPERHDELHPELDRWRANVGAPLAIDAGPLALPRLDGVDVLCWNVAIGRGRLDALLPRLRTGAFARAGSDPARPLVILLQEAYRSDDTVPGGTESRHHGGLHPGEAGRLDVAELAREHGFSLRYSPSMRNGTHASDRGNAILSSVRLQDAHAFLLPHVRQRRVVVTTRLAGHARLTFASAHLDTHGQPRREGTPRRLGGGRAIQAAALGAALEAMDGSVVLGADLNTFLGMTDPAMRALLAAGMHPARRIGRWRHTFHTPFRLLLDHVLYRSGDDRIAGAEVVRLDEAPGDRSRGVFGSDHHPLFARVELRSH
jgi:endonuclease/exonuclease/phosphatase family metal-dependent hydrolase